MRFSEEQILIRDMARDFSQRELAPKAAEWDEKGAFAPGVLEGMGQLGLMGMCVPQKWGGAGADFTSYSLAMEEVAAGWAAASSVMSVNNSPMCNALLDWGSDEQKERFLRPLAQGAIGCFCLTEPHAGSDAGAIKTRARRRGNRYVLNGTKQFITSGSIAEYALVFAVTDPAAGKRGISAFIMPTATPGFSVVAKEKKLGQRAADTCQIAFEDAELTPDMLLGEEGQGYRIALANLEAGRVAVAAQAVGIARAALEAAKRYAVQRETFGTPIIHHQAVAFRLSDMVTRLEAARQLTLHAARLRDEGASCIAEASMAKLFASETAETICSDAIQIHGGYGYVEGFPVERYYRDARICQIYEGTSDVQRMVISRSLVESG
ncbi:MAG: acyl-CoA dehydrogenase [Acidiferrobacteraceae bacterium]|jgi:alkylation response protein AidB-like acyl-CoA dehydrogenase|nr:acyl-CoA dehydrogenase [Acidiferrobacteraceae bacterium]MCP4829113.1 acyl-CoA dehydrogenase [Pseudomonadota bacterium]MDP6135270.1 acyl-CoA dehydrogenase family protein [Arenicellales bacterium]HJP07049.1 acyl-CoA dehydrogenase family protein [Arenicellales bacterium]|tara:strand:- start:1857 stop:2993 length:1137 start_codon:yes stop_codon:yes gene_type:complete